MMAGRRRRGRRAVCLGLALAGILMAPGAPLRAEGTVITKVVFEGGASLDVEVADTPEAQMVGLMHRNELPEGWGMLFVYPRPRFMSFWMKNTRIPLAIAFFDDDGKIVNIRHMRPFDETTRHRSRRRVRYALEVNDGWFREHGVRAGQRVQLLRRPLLQGEPRPRIPDTGGHTIEGLPQDRRPRIPVGNPVTVGGREGEP